MAKELRAVLFDLDGTLIDSIGLIIASFRHAFAEFEGPRPDESELIASIGTPLVTSLGKHARSPEELQWLRDRYRAYQVEHHDNMVQAFPGAVDMVTALRARGLATAIMTSKGVEFARRGLAISGFGDAFPLLVGIESTENHKPHPEPVLFALAQLGVEPEEAVFIGDSPHDIAAGNAAGVRSIAVTWGPFSRAELAVEKPSAYCDEVAGLLAII